MTGPYTEAVNFQKQHQSDCGVTSWQYSGRGQVAGMEDTTEGLLSND